MVYNPLDIPNLGASVAIALEAQPLVPLGSLEAFRGAGLYALYYVGDFPLYERLAEWNRESARIPIYVGKAVVDKARKGGEFSDGTTTTVLYRRILKHRSSIDAASNLNVSHFAVRFLVTLPVWIPLGEAVLIGRYRPLWNVAMDGFGNNDPGGGRRAQLRSAWDEVHPGRKWAVGQTANPLGQSEIRRRVEEHLHNLAVQDEG